MRALMGVALVLAACRSPEQPPDEGGVKAGTWRVQEVPECGFTVELPDFAARTDLTMAEFPDVVDVAYATNGGLAVECTVFPETMQLPTPRERLQKEHERSLRHVEGLAGGITDHRLTIDESGAAATYTVRFANGIVQRGRLLVVGRELHELSAAIGKGRSSEAELARLIASYVHR